MSPIPAAVASGYTKTFSRELRSKKGGVAGDSDANGIVPEDGKTKAAE